MNPDPASPDADSGPEQPSPQRRISVIIPCLNDAALLRRALSSIAAQDRPADEVIVVDNDSEDDSAAVAAAAGARVVTESRRGITWATQAGFNAATGDVLLRTDADVFMPVDFLRRLDATWDRIDGANGGSAPGGLRVVGVTGGGRFELPGWRGDLASGLYLGAYRATTSLALGHQPFFGTNYCIRRSWWEEVAALVDFSDTEVHEDMHLSFAVRPQETVHYEPSLILPMDPRALQGSRQVARRFRRGFHTITVNWANESPRERLAARGKLPAMLAGESRGPAGEARSQGASLSDGPGAGIPDSGYLPRYGKAAQHASRQIIRSYSTSFSLATSLLDRGTRAHIENLYAMVRIADEIVDGTAEKAGLTSTEVAETLDAYEAAVLAAPSRRFHTDPVLHAYADTARACAFNPEHVRAFFASMRMDLERGEHSDESLGTYVYGSAEVIGLLCLAVFLRDSPATPEDRATMERGAQALGAAFQKVNFLRDYGEDKHHLGRNYFPVAAEGLTPQAKDAIIADIREDLRVANAAIPLLPATAQVGVRIAAQLFEELTEQIAAADADGLAHHRASVPNARKLQIAAVEVGRLTWSQVARATRGRRRTDTSSSPGSDRPVPADLHAGSADASNASGRSHPRTGQDAPAQESDER